MARRTSAHAGDAHAVTMTAELSQAFRTKREGVHFVLDHVLAAFPDALVRVHTVDGRFIDAAAARAEPLAVAASNWAATARLVAQTWPDAVLIDIGSTTTDITPIVGGVIAARGRSDPERLREGELVYSGALRTPAEAIAPTVPFGAQPRGSPQRGSPSLATCICGAGNSRRAIIPCPRPTGARPPGNSPASGWRASCVPIATCSMRPSSAISPIACGTHRLIGLRAQSRGSCVATQRSSGALRS